MKLHQYEKQMETIKQNSTQSIMDHGIAVKNKLNLILEKGHADFPELSEFSPYLYNKELLLTCAVYHDIGKVKT